MAVLVLHAIVYINQIVFSYSSVDRHLSWFNNLGIVKSAEINIYMQVSLWYVDPESLGSYGNIFSVGRGPMSGSFLMYLRHFLAWMR